jgi:hypothetical protein
MEATSRPPTGVTWVARLKRWRAQLRIGDTVKTLGSFTEAGAAAAAVATARAARPAPPVAAGDPPLLPGVSWRDGRWRVRGVRGEGEAGGFASRGEAEDAARRKPRVYAMRGSVLRRPAPAGDAAAARKGAFITGYASWRAVETKRLLQSGGALLEGAAPASLRAELKRLWAARARGGGGAAGGAGRADGGEAHNTLPANAAGAAPPAVARSRCAPRQEEYNLWARQERARLLALPEVAQLDRVHRSAVVKRELVSAWRAKRGEGAHAAAASGAAVEPAAAWPAAGPGFVHHEAVLI